MDKNYNKTRQPNAHSKYARNLLTAKESISKNGCGSSLAVFSYSVSICLFGSVA